MAAEVEEWQCLLSLDGMAPGQVDRPHYVLSNYRYFTGRLITFQLSKILTYFHWPGSSSLNLQAQILPWWWHCGVSTTKYLILRSTCCCLEVIIVWIAPSLPPFLRFKERPMADLDRLVSRAHSMSNNMTATRLSWTTRLERCWRKHAQIGDHIQDVPNGRRRVGGVQPGGGQVHPAHQRQDWKLPGDLPWKGNVI